MLRDDPQYHIIDHQRRIAIASTVYILRALYCGRTAMFSHVKKQTDVLLSDPRHASLSKTSIG